MPPKEAEAKLIQMQFVTIVKRKATERLNVVLSSVKKTIKAAERVTKSPLRRILVVTSLAATAAVPTAMTMLVPKILLLLLFMRKRSFH